MPGKNRQIPYLTLWGGLFLCIGCLAGCVEAVPQEAVEAIESIDRDLIELRAMEFAPSDYSSFARQWVALRARLEAEEDSIRWPWEKNELELALRQLQEEGSLTVARLKEQHETLRRSAERLLAQAKNRRE